MIYSFCYSQYGITTITNPVFPTTFDLAANPHHPASSFFIQPREGALTPLVFNLLTTKNYVTWAQTMRRAINIKNKLGFVDGIITKLAVDDPLFAPWEHCNDMII